MKCLIFHKAPAAQSVSRVSSVCSWRLTRAWETLIIQLSKDGSEAVIFPRVADMLAHDEAADSPRDSVCSLSPGHLHKFSHPSLVTPLNDLSFGSQRGATARFYGSVLELHSSVAFTSWSPIREVSFFPQCAWMHRSGIFNQFKLSDAFARRLLKERKTTKIGAC